MPELKLPELLVVLAIILLLFGGKKLPELSRSLGESIRELRGSLNDEAKDVASSEKPVAKE